MAIFVNSLFVEDELLSSDFFFYFNAQICIIFFLNNHLFVAMNTAKLANPNLFVKENYVY